MKSSKTLIPAAVLLLGGVSWAMAEEHAVPRIPDFTRVDADGDGYISSGEAAKIPGLLPNLPGLDRDGDGDGRLNSDEYTGWASGAAEESEGEGG